MPRGKRTIRRSKVRGAKPPKRIRGKGTKERFVKKINEAKEARGDKFVVLVGEEGAVLVHVSKGEVINRLYSPAFDAPETAAFEEAVSESPKTPVILVFDTMDQVYVQQTLPPVTQFSINKLIKRRLERDFSSDYLKGAIKLGREAGGRKDWIFLMVAIQQNALLKSWLKVVVEWPNQCKGLHLLPVETAEVFLRLDKILSKKHRGSGSSQDDDDGLPEDEVSGIDEAPAVGDAPDQPALISPFAEEEEAPEEKEELDEFELEERRKAKKTKKKVVDEINNWQFICLYNKVSGIRQVVFRNGKLLLTRLSQPATDSTAATIAGMVEQEVVSTKEYLKRLGYSDKEPLSLIVVVAEEVRKHMDAQKLLIAHNDILTPHEVSEYLGLPGAAKDTDRYCDTIISAAIATNKKTQLRLITPSLKRQMNVIYTHYGVRAAAACLIVYFAYSSVTHFLDVLSIEEELEQSEVRLQQSRQQLDALKQRSSMPVEELERITSIVDVYTAIKRSSFSPQYILEKVSVSLEKSVRASDLRWALNENPPPAQPNTPAPGPTENMSMVVKFTMEKDGRDKLVQDTTDVLNVLKAQLPDHNISYESLPEIINENRRLDLSIGEANPKVTDDFAQVFDIKLLFDGPAASRDKSAEEETREKEEGDGTPQS